MGQTVIPGGNGEAQGIIPVTLSAAGSDTQVQFNDAGAFAGDANLTWDKTSQTLVVYGASANLQVTGTSPGANVQITDSSGQVQFLSNGIQGYPSIGIGDPQGNNNGTVLTVDDASQQATLNVDLIFDDYRHAPVLADRSDGHTYRLESVNGVLSLTLVT